MTHDGKRLDEGLNVPQRGVGQALRKYKLGSSAGQALILVMLALPLFFSLCAVVVDGTNLMVNKRQLQNASDAAALAAGQELGRADACAGDATCLALVRARVKAVIQEYSAKNGGPATLTGGSGGDPNQCASDDEVNCYLWPYKGSDHLVQVRLRRDVSGFFASLAGVTDLFTVNARAAGSALFGTSATYTTTTIVDTGMAASESTSTSTSTSTTTTGGIGAVAFANSTDCTRDQGGAALQYQGAGGGQIGALVTNGGISVSGSPAQPKTIDYLSLGRLGQSVSGVPCYDNFQTGGAQIATINNPPVLGPYAPLPWPVTPPTPPTPPNGCRAASDATAVDQKTLTDTTAVLRTTVNHGLASGDKFVVSIGDSLFDGWHTVTARTNTTITYTVPTAATVAATAASGTVTATSQNVGINSNDWKNTHPAGIYCVTGTGNLSFQGVNLDGYTFFVAGDIAVKGGTYSCYQ